MKQIGNSLLGFGAIWLASCSSGPSDTGWVRLIGSDAEETAHAVATAKDGSVYVTGSTQGTLGETPNRGGLDAFVAKFNSDGALQWKKTLASPKNEDARAIALDGDGNVVVTGYTGGALDGGTGPDDDQVFVAKLSSGGDVTWVKLYGETTPVTMNAVKESGEAIALGTNGAILVAGFTTNSFGKQVGQTPERDGFVLKLDGEGKVVDTTLFGTGRNDGASALALSPADGAIYVAGYTDGSLGGDQGQKNLKEGISDAFVARLGTAEGESWIRLVGTTNQETGNAIAVDPATAEVYVGGNASGGLTNIAGLGMGDGFVAKLDRTGKLLWQALVGGGSIDTLEGMAIGSAGRLFVTGATWSNLATREASGRTDAYLAELNPANGALVGALQKSGSDSQGWGRGVTADGQGRLIVAGRAGGTLDGQAGAGGQDALIWKLNEKDFAPKR